MRGAELVPNGFLAKGFPDFLVPLRQLGHPSPETVKLLGPHLEEPDSHHQRRVNTVGLPGKQSRHAARPPHRLTHSIAAPPNGSDVHVAADIQGRPSVSMTRASNKCRPCLAAVDGELRTGQNWRALARRRS